MDKSRMIMSTRSPKPPYYTHTRWFLLLSSTVCVWLYYNYAEAILVAIDSREFKSELGQDETQESTPEFRKVKRWMKIIFVLLSSAGILGQISGLAGAIRQSLLLVNGHLFLNLSVILVHLLLFLVAYIYNVATSETTQPPKTGRETSAYDTFLIVGVLTFLAFNLTSGYLFRRDLQARHRCTALTHCTCEMTEADARHSFAAQQQTQTQQGLPPGGEEAQPQPQQQYITAPRQDGTAQDDASNAYLHIMMLDMLL